MANKKFNVDVSRFFQKLGITFNQGVRRLAIDIHDRVVLRTPVDTGRARASWTVGIGEADLSQQPESFNNPGGAPGIAKQGQAKLASFDWKRDKRIILSNNLAYINALEHGHSQQAPHGMVRITVAEVAAELKARL